ncbi:hypothetical protein ACFV9W_33230 [Streptomyces sp. NPDC059897]|uniref:hypothetical protein n=1 Tax=Streptomyces sp. NPDC059897 TaxID=3346994 RepID=UPI00364E03E6
MSVVPDRAWALERNDRRLMFAPGPDGTLFAETAPSRVAAHCHPVWKVVLSAADQAHLARTAREFTGRTPASLGRAGASGPGRVRS